MRLRSTYPILFFFNDTATTEIYTLSLHDALPISPASNTFTKCWIRVCSVGRCQLQECCRATFQPPKSRRSGLTPLPAPLRDNSTPPRRLCSPAALSPPP